MGVGILLASLRRWDGCLGMGLDALHGPAGEGCMILAYRCTLKRESCLVAKQHDVR